MTVARASAARRAHRRPRADEGVPRQHPGSRSPQLHRRAGLGHRLPRPERRGQDHHAAHGARAGEPDRGHRDDRRTAATATSPTRSTVVGASLESSSFHPARTGRNHLRILCAWSPGCPNGAPTRCSTWSGSRFRPAQGPRLLPRHAAAARPGRGAARQSAGAVLDEPANGLDPDGIRWLRGFFRHLAGEGRTRPRLEPSAQRGPGDRRPRRDPQPRTARAGRHDRRADRRHRHACSSALRTRRPLSARWRHAPTRRPSTARRGLSGQVGHLAFAPASNCTSSRAAFDLEHLSSPSTRPGSSCTSPPCSATTSAAARLSRTRLQAGVLRSDQPGPRRVPEAAHHPGVVLAAARERRQSARSIVVGRVSHRTTACARHRMSPTCSARAATADIAVFVLGSPRRDDRIPVPDDHADRPARPRRGGRSSPPR